MDGAKAMASNEVLLKLQESMVKAVLLGQSLPGHDQPIKLPDLEFVTRQQFIYLVDTGLATGFALQGLPKPLKIVSVDTLRQEAQQSGEIAYLQFHVNEATESAIDLRLEARIASSDPQRGELGLSSVQVKFSKQGDQWKAVDPPLYSAT
jgi:hypothetical protein